MTGLPLLSARSLVLSLVVPGNPIPWQRAGRNAGRAYTTKRCSDQMDAIRWLVKAKLAAPERGPVELHLQFFRSSLQRCDGDNLEKLVWDAFNGFVWHDDDQVVDWSGSKRVDRKAPRTEIMVWKLIEQEEAE